MRKLAVFLLLLIPACANDGGQDANTLRIYFSDDPGTTDPAFAVDKVAGTLTSLIYPGLFRFAPDGSLQTDLAKQWSNNETTYTFTIDTSRRFDDGTRVDAPLIATCFRRLLDPALASPRRWVLERIEGAEAFRRGFSDEVAGIHAPNDSTLILELVAPFSPFPGLLAMPSTRIYPVDKGGAPSEDGGLPVCGGPWRIKQRRRGDRILLERRQGGEGFERLLIRIIPQPFTAVAEFEVGNLDLLDIPRAEVEYWQRSEAAERIKRRQDLTVSYIGLNVRRPPLSDRRVRQALNHAVDVPALIKAVRGGTATVSLGPVPPVLRDQDPAEPYGFRPELARQLLAEAGYPDGFSMEIWQKDSHEAGRLLEALQAYLAGVGVDVRIVVRDWGAFKDAIEKGSADAFFLDWLADYPDAENFLMPLFHSGNRGGGGNRCGFDDEWTDLCLEELQSSPLGESRRLLVDRLNEAIYSQAPWIWLWHPVTLQVTSERIEGYQPPVIFNGQDFLTVRLREQTSDS